MVYQIEKKYELAKKYYGDCGVNVDNVLKRLKNIPISIHCWQGDDLIGFENLERNLSSGGILATGNYPGKARNINELQLDINKAFSLIPGKKKLALHAKYGNFKKKKVNRNEISPEDFLFWVDWAKENNTGLDFNPTFFSHPYAESGYTLSSSDKKIRRFWVEHLKRSRLISNFIGEKLRIVCINNIWIPDGEKDITLLKFHHRKLLLSSLDEALSIRYPKENMLDSLESKLFGIGSESFVVGSHEFYLAYAVKNGTLITFDTGHYHPTEQIADKISAILPFISGIVLHLSRGLRWDSDHVTLFTEDIVSIMSEIVRSESLDKVYIGTDFFDASINRIGAWVIGGRSILKAILYALLEPLKLIRDYEKKGNRFSRLAMLEAAKTMPFEAVWNYFLAINNMPSDMDIIKEINDYDKKVLQNR
jgi:L-rhamnose isomerase